MWQTGGLKVLRAKTAESRDKSGGESGASTEQSSVQKNPARIAEVGEPSFAEIEPEQIEILEVCI